MRGDVEETERGDGKDMMGQGKMEWMKGDWRLR